MALKYRNVRQCHPKQLGRELCEAEHEKVLHVGGPGSGWGYSAGIPREENPLAQASVHRSRFPVLLFSSLFSLGSMALHVYSLHTYPSGWPLKPLWSYVTCIQNEYMYQNMHHTDTLKLLPPPNLSSVYIDGECPSGFKYLLILHPALCGWKLF